jgi:hypothetical protein
LPEEPIPVSVSSTMNGIPSDLAMFRIPLKKLGVANWLSIALVGAIITAPTWPPEALWAEISFLKLSTHLYSSAMFSFSYFQIGNLSYGNCAFGHGKAGRLCVLALSELKESAPVVVPWLLLSNPIAAKFPTLTPCSVE